MKNDKTKSEQLFDVLANNPIFAQTVEKVRVMFPKLGNGLNYQDGKAWLFDARYKNSRGAKNTWPEIITKIMMTYKFPLLLRETVEKVIVFNAYYPTRDESKIKITDKEIFDAGRYGEDYFRLVDTSINQEELFGIDDWLEDYDRPIIIELAAGMKVDELKALIVDSYRTKISPLNKKYKYQATTTPQKLADLCLEKYLKDQAKSHPEYSIEHIEKYWPNDKYQGNFPEDLRTYFKEISGKFPETKSLEKRWTKIRKNLD